MWHFSWQYRSNDFGAADDACAVDNKKGREKVTFLLAEICGTGDQPFEEAAQEAS